MERAAIYSRAPGAKLKVDLYRSSYCNLVHMNSFAAGSVF